MKLEELKSQTASGLTSYQDGKAHLVVEIRKKRLAERQTQDEV